MCRRSCAAFPLKQPCPACVAELLEWDTEQNWLSELIARDPANDPAHREATDAEWWAWVMSTR